ncbi:MAG: SAM-dependent DNA methyltransferase, partial [Planctomycetes bacterium]|nr:SAM-dependent DNA methyltransferase [Planctomycetota bacterium]
MTTDPSTPESRPEETTQSEINDLVWRACDTFRGTIDPGQYKDYILVALFLKYLTDLRDDKREQYSAKYNGDERRIERAMSRERFVLPPDSDFHYLKSKRDAKNLGEEFNMVLERIEDANKQKLDGVFRNIDFNSEANLGEKPDRNARLQHLIDDFCGKDGKPPLDLRPSRLGVRDVIGDAYEFLIGKFAADSGKKGGEFYTPGEVAQVLAKLVQPKSGDRICDPCCGSASLLIRAAREVGSEDFALFGQEANGSTWALARMNMFLHNINYDKFNIQLGDTLIKPHFGDDKPFDAIVSNP